MADLIKKILFQWLLALLFIIGFRVVLMFTNFNSQVTIEPFLMMAVFSLVYIVMLEMYFVWNRNRIAKNFDKFIAEGTIFKCYLKDLEENIVYYVYPSHDVKDERFVPVHQKLVEKGYVVVKQDINDGFVIYMLPEKQFNSLL